MRNGQTRRRAALNASAVIGGKTVATEVNSTFREFDIAKPDNPRGFAVDERFLAK